MQQVYNVKKYHHSAGDNYIRINWLEQSHQCINTYHVSQKNLVLINSVKHSTNFNFWYTEN